MNGAVSLSANGILGCYDGYTCTFTNSAGIDTSPSATAYQLTLNPQGTGSLLINRVISGSGAVVVAGSGGTVTFGDVNTYGGTTKVNASTLKLSAATNAIPTASATTVAGSATLDVNGKAQTLTAALTNGGTVALGTSGALTLTGGLTSTGTVDMGTTSALVLSGSSTNTISGPLALGGGTVTLSGTASLSLAGATVTGSGKIVVGPGTTLTLTSAIPANSGLEIELAGGTLNLGAFAHGIGTLTVSGTVNSKVDFASSGTAKLATGNLAMPTGGTQTLTVTNWTRGTDQFTATNVNGATTTTRNVAGQSPLDRITLTGATSALTVWTGTGATPANEITTGSATVKVQKITTGGAGGPFDFTKTNLASAPSSITTTAAGTPAPTSASATAIAVSTLNTDVTITESTATNYAPASASCTDANSATTSNTGPIGTFDTATGTLTNETLSLMGTGAGGVGALSNTAGANSWAGPVTLAAAASIGSTAGTLTITGTVAKAGFLLTTTPASGAAIALNGVVDGAGGLTQNGAGTTTLGVANNTYGGATTVSAGTLRLGVGSAMPVASATTVANGATLDVNGKTQSLSSLLTNNGTLALGASAAGTIVASGAALGLDNAQTYDLGAEPLTISGTGVSGSGALYNVASNSTWSGTITLGAAASIGSSSNTLTLGGTIANAGFDLTLSGAGNLAASGVISGSGALVKQGAGTAMLSAANVYGATTVSAGTLQLGINGAIPTASATTVASGATLDVNGKTQTLSGGLASSGTLALGTGGTLTLSGGTSTIGAVTGSGKIVVGSGATLTLTSALVNSGVEIELAGGTLNLGVLTHGIGRLTVSAASTLDFSGSAGTSQITAGTLALGGNALSVTNWTRGTDRFYATAFTGATANAIGSAPTNQITLTGPVSYASALTVWQTDKEINVLVNPTVRIAKTSDGGVGKFDFTMSGLSASSDTVTTTAVGTSVQGAAGITGTAGTAAVITESGVPAGWPANPTSATGCVDANGGSNGNGTAPFGNLSGNVLSVPAGKMIAGANITCTFVNSLNGLGGFVFDDGGAPSGGTNTGTPNDGLRNGGEAGIPGVTVALTDCAATTHASTTTDGSGAWSLGIPAGVPAGTTVCVSAAVGSTRLATGADAGTGSGTAVPDGATVTVGGVAYTYSRSAQRLRFATPAGGSATMSFGEVPVSTFTAPGSRQGAVNTPVDHPHNFVAGTGGSLALSITGEAPSSNSANAIWSGTIYADPLCTGKVQTGATQLYPGSVTTPVVQGQIVCVVLREPVPANADNGAVNQTTVRAALTFTNANPGLSASYTLVDHTTVGNSALVLLKEVRNVTTGGAWGTSNQARSGQVLEYRVTYTNTTPSPMTKVAIADSVPGYTIFQSATVGAVPNDFGTCTMNTPANPVPATPVSCTTPQPAGGTGALRWLFDGTLKPGGTGDVGFRVKVE